LKTLVSKPESRHSTQTGQVFSTKQQAAGNSMSSRRTAQSYVRGCGSPDCSLRQERVPIIEILTEPEEILDKGLKGRAGRYYSESQTLFVNGLYPIVERMSVELGQELEGAGEPEVVRVECLKAARRATAFRIGKVTCYAISKRPSEDWSADDLERATSQNPFQWLRTTTSKACLSPRNGRRT